MAGQGTCSCRASTPAPPSTTPAASSASPSSATPPPHRTPRAQTHTRPRPCPALPSLSSAPPKPDKAAANGPDPTRRGGHGGGEGGLLHTSMPLRYPRIWRSGCGDGGVGAACALRFMQQDRQVPGPSASGASSALVCASAGARGPGTGSEPGPVGHVTCQEEGLPVP